MKWARNRGIRAQSDMDTYVGTHQGFLLPHPTRSQGQIEEGDPNSRDWFSPRGLTGFPSVLFILWWIWMLEDKKRRMTCVTCKEKKNLKALSLFCQPGLWAYFIIGKEKYSITHSGNYPVWEEIIEARTRLSHFSSYSFWYTPINTMQLLKQIFYSNKRFHM